MIDTTCRCQKRKVKMRPIPMPMTQAVSMNINSRRLVRACKQVFRSMVLEPELDSCDHLDHGAELRHGPELAGEHLHPLGLLLQTLALVLGSRLNQVETMMILV